MDELLARDVATVICRQPAMATEFELVLVGDDPEHLRSVGTSAATEILRLEDTLSFFEPTSEISRINREAPRGATLVDVEVFEILDDCRRWFDSTDGFFDVLRTVGELEEYRGARFAEEVDLDASARTVRFRRPSVALDLGGYGKGYAVDRAREIVRGFGIENALLSGGTSSVFGIGRRADGRAWKVRIRNPFADGNRDHLLELPLEDRGFSVSSGGGATCAVLASTALEAEVSSTAFVAMGRERATRHLRDRAMTTSSVCWIERTDAGVTTEWLVRDE